MKHLWIFLVLCWAAPCLAAASTLDADKLVKRAEDQLIGKSFRGKLHMTILRPDAQRDLEILTWSEGRDKATVKILKPTKDQGVGNLRVKMDLWQYLPKVERLVKIPPSMMFQSWMGSDFTNDDLVKTSSMSRDYTHEFAGYETIEGKKMAKIVCKPKPEAPVVWGRVELWIDPDTGVTLQQDFYSETGEHIKHMSGSQVKKFGAHTIATRSEMKTLKKNTTTVLEYVDAHYDENLATRTFSQDFLKDPVWQ